MKWLFWINKTRYVSLIVHCWQYFYSMFVKFCWICISKYMILIERFIYYYFFLLRLIDMKYLLITDEMQFSSFNLFVVYHKQVLLLNKNKIMIHMFLLFSTLGRTIYCFCMIFSFLYKSAFHFISSFFPFFITNSCYHFYFVLFCLFYFSVCSLL
jgi:hypothetical protein